MIYRSKIRIFNYPAGLNFHLIRNTREGGVCDICGLHRMVDWYECIDGPITGIDCCRSCSKEHLEELDD